MTCGGEGAWFKNDPSLKASVTSPQRDSSHLSAPRLPTVTDPTAVQPLKGSASGSVTGKLPRLKRRGPVV